jgi:hypothetical protein
MSCKFENVTPLPFILNQQMLQMVNSKMSTPSPFILNQQMLQIKIFKFGRSARRSQPSSSRHIKNPEAEAQNPKSKTHDDTQTRARSRSGIQIKMRFRFTHHNIQNNNIGVWGLRSMLVCSIWSLFLAFSPFYHF